MPQPYPFQVLQALPALSATVVQKDNKKMVSNMAALFNLGWADIKAITILGLLHALYATKDYRSNHPLLIQEATVLFGGISIMDDGGGSLNNSVLDAVFAWNLGYKTDPYAVGTPLGISTDVSVILKEGRDFRVLPEQTLNRIIFLLNYRLSL